MDVLCGCRTNAARPLERTLNLRRDRFEFAQEIRNVLLREIATTTNEGREHRVHKHLARKRLRTRHADFRADAQVDASVCFTRNR